MAMLSFGGIDVSKDRLDIMVLPDEQCSWVSNDAAGWAELVEQLRGFSISAVGIEASGGYERGAVRALLAAGMSVRQVNPFKLRQFARASGVLALYMAALIAMRCNPALKAFHNRLAATGKKPKVVIVAVMP